MDIVTLRRIGPEEHAVLRGLHDRLRPELTLAGLPPAVLAMTLEIQHEAQEGGWATDWPRLRRRVIEVDGLAAGRVYDTPVGAAEVRLVELSIVATLRGQGIGGRVLRTIVDEWAGRTVSLHVLADNPAVRLYRRHGFVERGKDGMRLYLERAPDGVS